MKNQYAKWFQWVVWLGIIADWALGIPAIFAPNATLGFVGQRLSADPVWTAFAALLLILLSLFYIPGANDPYRYTFNAWMAVFARPPGVLFFFLLNPGYYPIFGALDLTLFIIQAPLLFLTMRARPKA
jgi:hypothetical protein